MAEKEEIKKDEAGSEEVPAFARERRGHPLFRRFISLTSLIGIIVLVGAFIALPNIVTFQPRFCSICHKEIYQSWSTSTHAKTGCLSCHVKSGFQYTVLSRVGLAQQIWMVLTSKQEREKPIGFISPPPNDLCLACHATRTRISPSGDIIIPHQSHIRIRKLNCEDCHKKFVCLRRGKGKAIVAMEGCLRCHNGRKATDECTACHTEKESPPSHRENWVLLHGAEAQADRKVCEDCHSKPKDFCKTCHGQKPPSHTANWGIAHGDLAKQNKAACLVCHEEQVTCAKCHGKTGRQHELGWQSVHPSIAKKGIRTCFECHGRLHCDQCHRVPR